jgi:hypothetical protein
MNNDPPNAEYGAVTNVHHQQRQQQICVAEIKHGRAVRGHDAWSMMVVLVSRWARGPNPFHLKGHIDSAGLLEGESP